MEETKEKAVAEADAATAQLQKSLQAAKSLVRDYKSKLCRKASDTRDGDRKAIFRFER